MTEEKTNVTRLLDKKKLPYKSHFYQTREALSGVEVARILGQDEKRVFKTLVTQAKSGKNYVFVIPVAKELDLKKAARAVGEKSIDMIKAKDLLPLTGYIHGGCSPIGMKKLFLTTIDESVLAWETFCFSGGRIGCQVEMAPGDLEKIVPYRTADLTVEP